MVDIAVVHVADSKGDLPPAQRAGVERPELAELLGDAFGILHKALPQGGELNALVVPCKQLTPQLLLQLANGEGEVWLGDKQILRRQPDGSGLRHHNHLFDLLQLHHFPSLSFRLILPPARCPLVNRWYLYYSTLSGKNTPYHRISGAGNSTRPSSPAESRS